MSGNAKVHFAAISTEVYFYYNDYDLLPVIEAQYNWLEQDLANAQAEGADWFAYFSFHYQIYNINIYLIIYFLKFLIDINKIILIEKDNCVWTSPTLLQSKI